MRGLIAAAAMLLASFVATTTLADYLQNRARQHASVDDYRPPSIETQRVRY